MDQVETSESQPPSPPGVFSSSQAKDNAIKRALAGAAKDGKDGLFAVHVDGVITPFAFGNLTAIHAEQLGKFTAVERDGAMMASPATGFVRHGLARWLIRAREIYGFTIAQRAPPLSD